MLADTLKLIHDTEEQANQILAQANLQVHTIEQETYQRIAKLEHETNLEIADEVANLPQPQTLPIPTVELAVPQTKMETAVNHIIQTVYEA